MSCFHLVCRTFWVPEPTRICRGCPRPSWPRLKRKAEYVFLFLITPIMYPVSIQNAIVSSPRRRQRHKSSRCVLFRCRGRGSNLQILFTAFRTTYFSKKSVSKSKSGEKNWKSKKRMKFKKINMCWAYAVCIFYSQKLNSKMKGAHFDDIKGIQKAMTRTLRLALTGI